MNKKTILLAALAGSSAAFGNSGDPVMTVDEAANWLKVPAAEMQVLLENGELPGRRIGTAGWRIEKAALANWLATSGTATPPTAQGNTPALTAPVAAAPAGAPGQGPAKDDGQGAVRKSDTDRRSSSPTAEETALRGVALLGKPGSFSLDASLAYTFNDAGSRGFATFGGRSESDILNAAVGASYRLNESTQVYATLPGLRTRSNVEDVSTGDVTSTRSVGWQPLALGVRRILIPENVGVPQVAASIDLTVPTQEGQQRRMGVALSMVKSLDPVTVFASVRSDRVIGPTRNGPGNRLTAGFGYVYALNDTLAVSTSVIARVEDASDPAAANWRRSKRFDLKLGLPTSFGKSGFYVEPYLSFGLNQSNSSTTIGASLVKTFGP